MASTVSSAEKLEYIVTLIVQQQTVMNSRDEVYFKTLSNLDLVYNLFSRGELPEDLTKQDPQYFSYLGVYYHSTGDLEKEIKYLEMGCQHNSLDCYDLLGSEMLNQGNYEKAIYYLEKALEFKIEPRHIATLSYALGVARCLSGDLEKGESLLNQSYHFGYNDALESLAELYANQNQFDLSIEYYKLAIDKKVKINWSNFICILLKADKIIEAEKYLFQLEQLQNCSGCKALGYIHLHNKSYKFAEKYFQKALEIHLKENQSREYLKRDFEISHNLRKIYKATNQPDKILEVFNLDFDDGQPEAFAHFKKYVLDHVHDLAPEKFIFTFLLNRPKSNHIIDDILGYYQTKHPYLKHFREQTELAQQMSDDEISDSEECCVCYEKDLLVHPPCSDKHKVCIACYNIVRKCPICRVIC